MRTPRPTLLIVGSLLLAALFSGLVWSILAPSEPKYGGKGLSAWLDELHALDYTKRADSETLPVRAIRAVGTNAIPWLLKEFRPGAGAWHWRCNRLLNKQHLISYRFPDYNDRLTRATLGFWALGEIAEPAIPQLMSLVDAFPGYVPGALAGIGRPAVPALQQCLTNNAISTNALGSYAVIPGNTISDIFNATSFGPFSKSDIEVFLPTIQNWAQQSTNQQAQAKASWFMAHYNQLE